MLKAEVQIPPYQKIDKINEPQDDKTSKLNKLDNNLRPTIQKLSSREEIRIANFER